MTATVLPNSALPARQLVAPTLYDRLTHRIVTDHGVDQRLAERIMTEALAYLRAAAVADKPLSPTPTVDIGWHTFLLYTREYAEFCKRVAGRFIHHVPDDDPCDDRSAADGHEVLRRTVAALTATGHRVDADLWMPAVPRCNSGGGGNGTGKCSQCHAGCVNSPS